MAVVRYVCGMPGAPRAAVGAVRGIGPAATRSSGRCLWALQAQANRGVRTPTSLAASQHRNGRGRASTARRNTYCHRFHSTSRSCCCHLNMASLKHGQYHLLEIGLCSEGDAGMRAALTSCLFVLSCVGCERSSAPVPGHGVKFPDAVASIANKTVAEDVFSSPLARSGSQGRRGRQCRCIVDLPRCAWQAGAPLRRQPKPQPTQTLQRNLICSRRPQTAQGEWAGPKARPFSSKLPCHVERNGPA